MFMVTFQRESTLVARTNCHENQDFPVTLLSECSTKISPFRQQKKLGRSPGSRIANNLKSKYSTFSQEEENTVFR